LPRLIQAVHLLVSERVAHPYWGALEETDDGIWATSFDTFLPGYFDESRVTQMPIVPFDSLPDDARLWVFAASEPVSGERAGRLLAAVDAWLADWKAHGEPLTCARDWRDGRFLAIGVDQSTAGASGCSIDALFRVFKEVQANDGPSMLGGGRVFYCDAGGQVVAQSRTECAKSATPETRVFDTSVTTAGAYRSSFEKSARDSWHRDLLSTAPSI
jgi:hypothetical protein